ncbi:hypothetical protein [Nocardioides gilvus]|uniref:hypothetical protein n=1 Tax=Nocardioides gilvus TaxID=1735589 RepID=UPI000D7426E6|nr:hypothetical protein [Nocardioides gilvus]
MNDDLNGQRLGAGLRDHMGQSPYSPLDLDDVKSTASRIRRRRTLTGVAVAAVAAAALIPAAFFTPGGEDTRRPIDPTTQTPTPTMAPTMAPTPRADVTLREDAPRGDDPADWSHPTFTDQALTHDSLPDNTDRVARIGERWVLSTRDDGEGKRTVQLLDADGDVVQKFAARSFFAISDNHELVAWTTDDSTLMLMDSQGKTRLLAKLPGDGNAIDVTGGAGCIDESVIDDCRVVVSYDSPDGPAVVSGDGVVTPISQDITGVRAAFSDFAAGFEKTTTFEAPPCMRLIDVTDGETQWRNCDVYVTSFSPDGRWTTVVDAQSDGWGPSRVGIADAATGKVYFWLDPSGDNRALGTPTWEGSEHLVVDSYDFTAQEWRLYRVSLTGEEEQAADMVEGDDVAFPFIAPIEP